MKRNESASAYDPVPARRINKRVVKYLWVIEAARGLILRPEYVL